MTEKRFTDIEHDFENARIRCKDNGLFMLYAIYEDDEGLIALGDLLNGLDSDIKDLKKENEQLKQQLQKIRDSFEVSITQNRVEFNKDKIYIKDMNTELRLNGENLFIEVYIPQIKEYYRFKYIVTGRDVMREFIKDYNLKEVHND